MAARSTSPLRTDTALYREFEHTGDTGIELSAPTRSELFRRAAIALGVLLVDVETVAANQEREITVDAETDADLMHDLLGELLNLFVVDSFIWRDASVEGEQSLAVTVYGERFDPARHDFRGEIKAVTYHQLSVEQAPDGWHARVIFDI
jgi:SHS2 domain-containing protein